MAQVTFLDETGLNPLPVGVFVSLYPSVGPQNATTLLGSAYVGVGGAATLPVVAGSSYSAAFSGTQAPSVPVVFPGSQSTVVVSGYRSTTFSTAGWAQLMASPTCVPRGWFADAELLAGGTLYALAYGFASGFNKLDQGELQIVLSMLRLQTSVGSDVDSWATDFFGTLLQRISTEPDAGYVARLEAWLQAPKASIAGVTAAVNAYVGLTQYFAKQQAMGADTFGGADTTGSVDQPVQSGATSTQSGLAADTNQGAADTLLGVDVSTIPYNPPNIIVFDLQSNPTLSATLGLTTGQFAVYFQYSGYADSLIHAIGPYSNILAQFVGAVKAEGTSAIYASNHT